MAAKKQHSTEKNIGQEKKPPAKKTIKRDHKHRLLKHIFFPKLLVKIKKLEKARGKIKRT